MALANEALITPELCNTLAGHEDLQSDVVAFLRDVEARTRRRNDRLITAICHATQILNDQGIEPILMKGAALWASGGALAHPARARLTTDIDLLAQGSDFERSLTALSQAGYRVLEDNLTNCDHPVVVLGREGDVGAIDLHRRPPGRADALGVEALIENATRVRCGSATALVPALHMQLFILIMHDQILDAGFWRGAFNLRHLIDIAEIVRGADSLSWEGLMELARRAGAHQAVCVQLLAAQDIAGAVIPMHVTARFSARLHYARQRLQFINPWLNTALKRIGLNDLVWRALSLRRFRTS
ncbi:MAG: nucleotidyltransferase family protein [Hyphomonadaceae bacterium]|nr:nucleotidyltransferase family protein [Hyphomonadaceae bacterium]MBY0565260.1 nucleotidyltransferase family protein [Hyphomonadaceae bacterium]